MAVLTQHSRPSYKQGFARFASESANPRLWKGFAGALVPNFGPTGNTVHDVITGELATLEGGAAFDLAGPEGYVVNLVKSSSENIKTTNDTWLQGGNYSFAIGIRSDSVPPSAGNEHTMFSNLAGAGTFESHTYSPTIIQDGTTFHHWFGSLDGTTFELWQDGVSLGTKAFTAGYNRRLLLRIDLTDLGILNGTVSSKGPVWIGSSHTPADYFDGSLLYMYMWEGIAHKEAIAKQIHRDHLAPFRRLQRYKSTEYVKATQGGAYIGRTKLLRPSYQQGFARSASESANPNLWKDLVWGIHQPLGPSGSTVHDFVGGLDAVLTSMTADEWEVGEEGWATAQLEVNDRLRTATQLVTHLHPRGFTARVHVDVTGTVSNGGMLGYRDSGLTNGSWSFYQNSGNVIFNYRTSGTNNVLTWSGAWPGDGVSDFVFTRRPGGVAEVWINGVSQGTETDITEPITGAQPLNVGSLRDTISFNVRGRYFSAQIWHRVLDYSEIRKFVVDPDALVRRRRRALPVSTPAVAVDVDHVSATAIQPLGLVTLPPSVTSY